jgi:flagellar protein FlgJ
MPTSSIGAIGGVSGPSLLPLQALGAGSAAKPVPTDDAGRAAQQFEAILLRQFLTPAIQPMMGGNSVDGSDGSDGGEGGSGGEAGGVYSFLLTDVLANAMSQGGGLGLAGILKRQFTKNTTPTPTAGGTEKSNRVTPPAKLVLPKGLLP